MPTCFSVYRKPLNSTIHWKMSCFYSQSKENATIAIYLSLTLIAMASFLKKEQEKPSIGTLSMLGELVIKQAIDEFCKTASLNASFYGSKFYVNQRGLRQNYLFQSWPTINYIIWMRTSRYSNWNFRRFLWWYIGNYWESLEVTVCSGYQKFYQFVTLYPIFHYN